VRSAWNTRNFLDSYSCYFDGRINEFHSEIISARFQLTDKAVGFGVGVASVEDHVKAAGNRMSQDSLRDVTGFIVDAKPGGIQLIDYWMGHANGEMSGRYGKQLLDNLQWRKECAAKVGLGFVLPTNKQQAMIDKSGQVLRVEEQDAVAV
jgi:hypothetical protein